MRYTKLENNKKRRRESMKDTYVVKRKANGRFSKRGYMFDDDKLMDMVEITCYRIARKSFIIGLVVGSLVTLLVTYLWQ